MSSVSLVNQKNLGEISEEIQYSSIDELAAIISSEPWAPGIFSERRRLISNLTRIDLLVLDIDDGCTLESATEKFKDYKHIIATSKSHQKEKNDKVCDRFRVVLFLKEAIDSDRVFKTTWAKAYAQWPFIDKACKDSSRFFYPSPEIVSINRGGLEVEPIRLDILENPIKSQGPELDQVLGADDSRPKGELWKSTLKFLLEGAPAGQRHPELVKAVGNMREQGYSKAEVLERVEEMSHKGDWTQPGLNANDLKTIDRMFEREMKYGYVPPENQKNESALIVNANELLDEAFEYLSDKEKVKGEPTGIEGLDRLLGGGFRTGELTVLMAQAKTGKNTLYHYLMYKHLERGLPYGYASRELNPAQEVVPNLLTIALQTNLWLAQDPLALKERARTILNRWALHFAPGYGYFDINQMETWFRECRNLGVTHFLFDHFHYALMKEDHDSTSILIRKLKQLTKELDIHLSLIVQPRGLRDNEVLSPSTLRGGVVISQALDNLLILERVKGETNISKLTLEVARHKVAKPGSIYLQYNTETTSFIEVDKQLVSETTIPQGMDPRGKYGNNNDRRPWPRV